MAHLKVLPRTAACRGHLCCLNFEKKAELLFYLNINLFLRLHCALGMACELLVAASGIQSPDQRLSLGPLHWESGFLATRRPGKSLHGPGFKQCDPSAFLASSPNSKLLTYHFSFPLPCAMCFKLI